MPHTTSFDDSLAQKTGQPVKRAAMANTLADDVPLEQISGEEMPKADHSKLWHEKRLYVTTSHGDIAYHDVGEGPALLLIHGFPLNAYHWRDVMRLLAGERRCIAPDLLGLGYTRPATNADLSLSAQAAMLVELLDSLGLGEADIIANDSGTAIAQLLAVGNPHRVRSMLLTNGDVEPDCPPQPLLPVIELARQGTFAEATISAALADKALARSEQGIIGLTYSHPELVSDEAIALYFAPLIESLERIALTNAYACSFLPNPLEGLEAELRSCTVPTAILWGTADVFFREDDIDYLVSVLPDVRHIRRVDDAKLFFPEEQPELVVEAARKLWTSIS
jgi:pimeloyl-ACP methyl ester carboxylesterase